MLARARQCFEEKSWSDSFRLFEAADREASLDVEDLERAAAAAYLLGRDDESEAFRTRAHHACLDRGDAEGAAGSAIWIAFGLQQRGAVAPASGWFVRAGRILDEAQLDSVARGYLLIPAAIQRIVQGDPAAGYAAFEQAEGIARRFGDRDLASFACMGRGRALIHLGDVRQGVALLDEAMTAVIAGDVSPILSGDIYCAVLEACQDIFDLRRAYEWTTSLTRWCAAQPGLVRYRGECLLYRAEVMQLHGDWRRAADDARESCALLKGRPVAGAALYRLGEIHRLREEFEKADEAFARANEHGRKPQPGVSLLRLAQGQVEAAAASIRGVLVETRARAARARALAAAVDILLAARDLDAARAAATELSEIANTLGAQLLAAASAHATGAVRLEEGDLAGAAVSLRQASELWRDLEMPYEEAHSRLLMAAVCERRSDDEGRRLELDAARTLFAQINAEACLARLAGPARETPRETREAAGPLSEREVQVLRLLADGKTNRHIAEALFISEKTVARHVSNIFDKLAVSNRAAATAWAYQRHLV